MKHLGIFDLNQKIEIIDIGAAAIAEKPIYSKLVEDQIANLNAFEGDKRQSDKLKSRYGNNVKLYNEFLFDGSVQNLYLAHPDSGMTSLFKPSEKVLKFFNGFSKFGKIEKIEKIKTEKLDNIFELPHIDFAKLDIQGSELTVLKNGVEKLKNCLAIQLEVSFVCLYEDQPSFGEVDLWMRSNGYLPHTFLDIKRWSISPTIFNNNFRQPGNQLLESDIIYIKDPFKLDLLSTNQLKKFILISHYLFKSIDLSVYLILELERRNVLDKQTFKNYISNFKKYS